ncbi:MAG: tail fiber domain-containing protein [Roseburia sp.]
MAKFNSAYLTDAGADLIAKTISDGSQIEFVEMALGEGTYTEEEKNKENLCKRTDLKAKRQGIPFSSVSSTKENAIKLKAIVSNENITDGYRMTEIGIIAKKSGDEASNGILYSIAIAEEPDYIPSKDNPITYIQEYYTKVSNAEQVGIKTDNGAYALAEHLTNHINNTDNPHQVTKEHVGLGNVDNTADSEKPVSKEQQRVIDEKYKSANTYTDQKIAQLVNGAPEALDTLKEIADEIAKNKTVVESINAAIGTKANAVDVENHKNEANQLIAQKVSKAGDAMQGPLHFPSGVMNNLGDDCSFGDQDHAGAFCIRGLNGETTLNLIGNDTTAEWCSLRYTNANNDMQLLNLGYINAQTDSGFQVRNHDNSAWNGISAAAFNQQSSRKYKKNIANMDEETARQIMAYRPVTYDYKNEIDGTNCMGLIAEEVAEINTYPVTYQNNKPEAIDYAKFVPQIIKMLQIQQNEINALKVGKKDE